MNTDDRVAADASYRQALEVAKAEHDELEPTIQKMLERRGALRGVIRACSTLLDVPLDEKYDWRITMEQVRGTAKAARR